MANMKLYMTPGSCSTGIHILMEELGLVFEAWVINLPNGDQYEPGYVAINPKSTIPTLVKPDGTAITEFLAIAYWLAHTYPRAKLLPGDIDGDTLALETMNYIVSTIHLQGFTRIFTPDKYAFEQSDEIRATAQGEFIVNKGLALINRQLVGRDYITGEFSIADAALFYCEFWADRINIILPAHCLAHYHRMLQRPSVKQVMIEEGYISLYQ